MAPRITSWGDLSFVSEEDDPKTGQFLHTSFAIIDDSDNLYYGQLKFPTAKVNFDQVTHALKRVPDHEIFPKWPASGMALTRAPETPTVMVHIKRPALDLYEKLKECNQLHRLSEMLLAEAQVMEVLSRDPHPNIIRYYGCRVIRGHITGLVLDRHNYDLETYIEKGVGVLDKFSFMNALESSIQHLHARGWAHNDVTPTNILVNEDGMPTLIDFGGCQPVGTRLKYIRGTKGWIDSEIEDYTISDEKHDLSALAKIGAWLDESMFIE